MNSKLFNVLYTNFGKNRVDISRSGGGGGSALSAFASKAEVLISPDKLSRCSMPEARAVLGSVEAEKLGVLPLGLITYLGQKVLSLAVPAGHDISLLKAVKFTCGYEVKGIEVDPAVLPQAIFMAYGGDEAALTGKIAKFRQEAETKPKRLPAVALDFRLSNGGAPELVAGLVDYALSHQASDIHILPKAAGSFVQLRIKGRLLSHEEALCSLEQHAQLVSRIKVLAGLDTTSRNMPQDGSFVLPLAGGETSVRIGIMPTVHGEKAVIRLFGCGGLIALADLGTDPQTLSALEVFKQRTEGALLIAGPTGSGKSSTMYALMDDLSRQNRNCVGIEDPVELHLPGVSQTSINARLGLDYATCLRSVLRQDPDVILLGEIRDIDSAKIAMQAALTGHLLLSTVHARNVFEVFLRLHNLGVDCLSLAQACTLVVCQRLLPELCASCKVLDLQSSNRTGMEVYREVGCAHCDHSGFGGRVLATESLSVSYDLSREIAKNGIPAVDRATSEEGPGYVPMRQTLELLLRQGRISMRTFASLAGICYGV